MGKCGCHWTQRKPLDIMTVIHHGSFDEAPGSPLPLVQPGLCLPDSPTSSTLLIACSSVDSPSGTSRRNARHLISRPPDSAQPLSAHKSHSVNASEAGSGYLSVSNPLRIIPPISFWRCWRNSEYSIFP